MRGIRAIISPTYVRMRACVCVCACYKLKKYRYNFDTEKFNSLIVLSQLYLYIENKLYYRIELTEVLLA